MGLGLFVGVGLGLFVGGGTSVGFGVVSGACVLEVSGGSDGVTVEGGCVVGAEEGRVSPSSRSVSEGVVSGPAGSGLSVASMMSGLSSVPSSCVPGCVLSGGTTTGLF